MTRDHALPDLAPGAGQVDESAQFRYHQSAMQKSTIYERTHFLDTLSALIRAMRPKQWPKNGFVFAALVFAEKLTILESVTRAILAAFLFCIISGVVYLINDLVDIEKDRRHPTKRFRPLAAGQISPATARYAAVALTGISLPTAFWLSIPFGLVLLLYLVLQIAYSFALKNLVILDVLSVAAGFVLRAVGGAVVINVPISPWLYVCTALFALLISFSRRRHEIILLEGEAGNHRASLNDYSAHLLDHMIAVAASSTIIAYSLYTFLGDNVPDNYSMMLTIPFGLYGVYRYLYLIHIHNQGGTPEEILFKDKPLIINAVLWGLTAIAILYLQ